MRVFQYLVALSDLAICLMSLFMALSMLLKPAEDAQPPDRVAEKIDLAKSKGAGKPTKPDSAAATHLYVFDDGKLAVRIPGEGSERVFESVDKADPKTLKLRGKVVVFAHRRVEMELLAKVMDLLRDSAETRSPPPVELAFIKEKE